MTILTVSAAMPRSPPLSKTGVLGTQGSVLHHTDGPGQPGQLCHERCLPEHMLKSASLCLYQVTSSLGEPVDLMSKC